MESYDYHLDILIVIKCIQFKVTLTELGSWYNYDELLPPKIICTYTYNHHKKAIVNQFITKIVCSEKKGNVDIDHMPQVRYILHVEMTVTYVHVSWSERRLDVYLIYHRCRLFAYFLIRMYVIEKTRRIIVFVHDIKGTILMS